MNRLSFAKASCMLFVICIAIAVNLPAQTVTTLQNFPSSSPTAALIQGADGNFYSTKAFDAALGRELHEVIQEAKKMASQIRQSSDLWDLEHYLTERRKEINRKYDYRYSQLTHVFGRLLHEKRLREEDLRGLRED